jgi:NitT/TauT family transport system substrate-binding protein
MKTWKRKLAGATAASFAVALGAAAPAGATAHAARPQRAPRAKHLTTLNLSYNPYSNDSSMYLAIEKGIFRQHGLNLKLHLTSSPIPSVAALESGESQLAFVTITVAINVTAHGTPLKCISSVDGNQGTNPQTDGTLLVANPKSGISSIADLKGKTVATVQLASLNTLDVEEMVHEAGVNPGAVHFVPMPFQEMPQALQQGTVDAAVITTPWSATAVQNGAKVIAHPNIVVMGGESTTCFAATASYADHHVKLMKEFQAAMDQAIAETKADPAAAAATLVKFGLATNLKEAEASKLGTDFNPTIKVSSIAKTERLLERFGYITSSQAPNPASLVFPGA